MSNTKGIGTKCVQSGYTPKNGEPRQIPIIQSTTFKYDTSSDMGKLLTLSTKLCKRIIKHNHKSQPTPQRISSFPRITLQFG